MAASTGQQRKYGHVHLPRQLGVSGANGVARYPQLGVRPQVITWNRILSSLVLVSLVAGCGGGAEPTDPGGNGDPNQMTREIKTNPSFTRDIQEIIERGSCNDSACHGPASGEAGLTLSTDLVANYRNLVNVPARSERQFLLVEPGDADNSYLVIRFEDRQSVGALMPIGLPLDSIDLTNFRNWINNGAPEN